jgi:hypothetical protein
MGTTIEERTCHLFHHFRAWKTHLREYATEGKIAGSEVKKKVRREKAVVRKAETSVRVVHGSTSLPWIIQTAVPDTLAAENSHEWPLKGLGALVRGVPRPNPMVIRV